MSGSAWSMMTSSIHFRDEWERARFSGRGPARWRRSRGQSGAICLCVALSSSQRRPGCRNPCVIAPGPRRPWRRMDRVAPRRSTRILPNPIVHIGVRKASFPRPPVHSRDRSWRDYARCASCSRPSAASRLAASTWSASRSISIPPRSPARSCSTSSVPSRTSRHGSSPSAPVTASPRRENAADNRVDRRLMEAPKSVGSIDDGSLCLAPGRDS